MTLSKKITLYNLQQGYGSNPQPIKVDSKTVWCKVTNIGAINAANYLSVGVTLTKQIEMWESEYNGEAYATIDGKDYKIEMPVQAKNSLRIKLLLSRG